MPLDPANNYDTEFIALKGSARRRAATVSQRERKALGTVGGGGSAAGSMLALSWQTGLLPLQKRNSVGLKLRGALNMAF